ncbi:hypothetical protein BHE90_004947 [Fusarium euwallaceae]|uniref:Uncharacterized protein n=5 Tax=Fusarium solani species complex TaxID=232080 RepID=A0A3M2RA96_9HYPO|nr:hypothetical protein CDV36_015510 [Fusarium kuroshium]RSL76861.1 hypothetical protein CEP51_009585 [Fusarium floridanum]RSL87271.1 hypothetical protein CDV31_016283 [Fusarium ambrosium]RSL92680.1 hypothetical protein CEP52_013683 [Fusarium oligoseptatum]RTE80542.1 hypothetical protein BHE90_004947 [Fusarium euwallaceae]
MVGKQGPAKSLLTFVILGSILGNVVVGLPVTPTAESKDDDVSADQEIFYSVQCEAGTWGVATHCQAWCDDRGHMDFNTSRCPFGSHNADDLFSDCYCVGGCAICKEQD